MSEPVLGFDCEHDRDDGMARDLLFTLANHYPGHSWHILVKGGIVKISNLDWMGDWGMCFPYAEFTGDAKVLKQKTVRFAGEFLERANVKRGAKGEAPKTIEGVDRKALQKAGIVDPDPIKVVISDPRGLLQ